MILTVTPNPCVDKTVYIDRLEAGRFMRSERYVCVAGGKGVNTSRAVKALGRPTRAFVVVGGHSGEHVVEMISEDDGVDCFPVRVISPTRTVTTALETEIQRQTALYEPGSKVTTEEYREIVVAFRDSLNDAQVVCFNGTVSDPAISRLYADLIPIAKERGAITILDAHGPEFAEGLQAKPYMAKPNLAEAEEVLGRSLENEAAKWGAVDAFHEMGIEMVVLSLGKDGAFVSRGDVRLHANPPRITEVNPVGSGDALVAGFAIGLLENLDLPQAAALAVAAGTANAAAWEIARFTRNEVEATAKKIQIRML